MWLLALTLTGMGGMWLVAKHWWGWLVYLVNEVLWFAYGLMLHATPLYVMAVLWFSVGVRNLVVTRRASRVACASDL
jgi:hypothetical protein